MRALRLVFGVVAIVQAIISKDIVLGLLGFVVGGMAFFNVGCCSDNSCSNGYKKDNNKKNNDLTDVEYEEVLIK